MGAMLGGRRPTVLEVWKSALGLVLERGMAP